MLARSLMLRPRPRDELQVLYVNLNRRIKTSLHFIISAPVCEDIGSPTDRTVRLQAPSRYADP